MSKKKSKNLEEILQSLNNDELIVLSYSSKEDEEDKTDSDN
jgi:hypothetical protein